MASESASGLMNTRSQYWEWSKPSLVLAIVTALFALASVYTQRRIQGYYRGIVSSTLESVADRTPVSISEIQRAELANKRLGQQASDPSELQFSAAKLANDASMMHASRAIAFREEGELQRSVEEMERSRMATRRTVDSMRRLGKMNGTMAAGARLWLLGESVPSGPLMEVDWNSYWHEIRSQTLQAITDSGTDEAMALNAIRLSALSTLSTAMDLTAGEGGKDRAHRRGEVENAWNEVATVADLDPRCFMIRIEGMECLEPGQGVPIARARFKDLLAGEGEINGLDGRQREMERIDSVFVSLLVLDSTDEAFAYAMNHLAARTLVDPEALRAVLTQSVMRAIGRAYWFPNGEATTNSKRIAGLIKGLFVLGIKYPQALELVDRIVFLRGSDAVAGELGEALSRESGAGIATGIDWLRDRFVLRENVGGDTNRASLVGVDDELAVPMLGFIGYMIREKQGGSDVAIGAIDEMARNWPWIGELRVAQAMLATELGRDDQAIAILAELNEKIPDNAQIQNMLVQAYERALKKR